MNIDIICPLYNCASFIINLNKSIENQKIDVNFDIKYVLTESSDNSKEILKNNDIGFIEIRKKDFSHSLTREMMAKQSKADIICFISQDIEIKDNKWLYNLVKPIIEKEAEASYSRQISKFNNIEKYTREYNYPQESYVKTKKDIETMGLRTFFYSDSSSAIDREVFAELNYYDGKNLPTNEDMYIAHKLIMNGYRIKYCSDSIVYHSHNYSLKDVFNRYKETGIFFKENSFIDDYKTNSSGKNLAIFILKEAFKRGDIKTLLRFPFDMFARLIGMKIGKR